MSVSLWYNTLTTAYGKNTVLVLQIDKITTAAHYNINRIIPNLLNNYLKAEKGIFDNDEHHLK